MVPHDGQTTPCCTAGEAFIGCCVSSGAAYTGISLIICGRIFGFRSAFLTYPLTMQMHPMTANPAADSSPHGYSRQTCPSDEFSYNSRVPPVINHA